MKEPPCTALEIHNPSDSMFYTKYAPLELLYNEDSEYWNNSKMVCEICLAECDTRQPGRCPLCKRRDYTVFPKAVILNRICEYVRDAMKSESWVHAYYAKCGWPEFAEYFGIYPTELGWRIRKP